MSTPTLPPHLTLPQLYSSTLHSLVPHLTSTSPLPLTHPTTQSTLHTALSNIDLILRLTATLGLFSENEELREVADGELGFMALDWVRGEVVGMLTNMSTTRTGEGEGGGLGEEGIESRLKTLRSSKLAFCAFLRLLKEYEFPTPGGYVYPALSGSDGLDDEDEDEDMDADDEERSFRCNTGSSMTRRAGRMGKMSSSNSTSTPLDPGQRREAKIKQYRLEKEWKDKVQAAIPGISLSSSPLPALLAIVDAAHPNASSSSSSSSSTGGSRINLGSGSGTSVNPEPSSSTSSSPIKDIRSTTISLLTLLLITTTSSLSSINAEIDLLTSASMSARIIQEDQERRTGEREEARRKQEGERVGLREEERWRLDMGLVRRKQRGKVGGLIDDRGKPTQPFTILPSEGLQGLSDRARLGAEVFRSGHRLPTMTIDEYLEEERRRGNILTGGGAASENAPTSTEILQLASEQDGTRDGRDKEEEKRRKEEDWAVYTELNKKGAGNTMNRG